MLHAPNQTKKYFTSLYIHYIDKRKMKPTLKLTHGNLATASELGSWIWTSWREVSLWDHHEEELADTQSKSVSILPIDHQDTLVHPYQILRDT
jgi:hypothetical protein